MALEAYTTGTVSIANGSTALTGSGTAWKTAALKAGDFFLKNGYAIPIASVDDEDAITLVDAWPGMELSAAGYALYFQPDSSRMQGTTRQLLDQLRAGIWLNPDATGKTADKATYDAKPAGFRFLDVSVDPFKLYVKESDTSGDWSSGADWVGPKGDDGAPGSSDVVGTSTTSVTIATGSKTFAIVEEARGWGLGARLRASSDADGTNWMEGVVTAYADDSLTLSVDRVGGSGTKADWTINLTGAPSAGGREVLTANRNYYVRTDGSDSNNGLSNTSGGAFLTINKALSVVQALDLSIYNVTTKLGAGTYTGAVSLSMPFVGSGSVSVIGDTTTPSNVLLNITGNAVTLNNGATLTIQGVKVVSTGHNFYCQNNSTLTLQHIEYGGGTAALYATYGSSISIAGGTDHVISGDYTSFINGLYGRFNAYGATVTLSGTRAFGTAFVYLDALSYALMSSMTFVGSATGERYLVNGNSVLPTAGGGASYLPGSTAGSTSNGGIYT